MLKVFGILPKLHILFHLNLKFLFTVYFYLEIFKLEMNDFVDLRYDGKLKSNFFYSYIYIYYYCLIFG